MTRKPAQSVARSRSLLLGFLLSYLIVLGLPTISGGLIYLMASGTMQRQVDRSNITRLRDTKTITDQQLITMIAYVDRIAINQDITALSRMNQRRPSSTDILDVMASAEAFRRYNNANPLIAEYYIHYNRSGITFSSSNIYLDFNRFYGSFFQWSDMSQVEWSQFASEERHDRVFLPAAETLIKDDQNDKSGQALLYIQSLPLEYRSRKDGYLTVLISTDEIQRLLTGVELGDTGQVLILNETGQIMSSIKAKDAEQDLMASLPELPDDDEGHLLFSYNNQQYSLTYVRSVRFGWLYLAAVPTDFVYSQLAALRTVLAITLLVAIVLGLLLAIRLSSRNAKSWQDIRLAIGSTILEQQRTAGVALADRRKIGYLSELDRIRQNVLQLVQKNQNMSQVLEVQLPVIQAGFINRLLTGRINTREQLSRELQIAGMPLEADGYLVMLIKMENLEDGIEDDLREHAVKRLILQEQVRQKQGGLVYAADDVLEDGIAFLMLLDGDDLAQQAQQLRTAVNVWQQDFRETARQLTRLSAGAIYTDPLDIHRSLNEARLALPFATLDKVAWFDDLPSQQQSYYFPFELEHQLMNQVLAGNKASIDHLFQRLVDENIVNRKMNPLLSRIFSAEICGLLVRILDRSSYNAEQMMKNIQHMDNYLLPDLLETARTICQSIADKVIAARDREDTNFKDTLIAFADQSLSDSGFCMDSLRTKFPVSATYINALFLERTGHTLSNYMEEIRLIRAMEMLRDNSHTVQTIAEAVGYTSAHSFRRAFKRRYNVLPTDCLEPSQK